MEKDEHFDEELPGGYSRELDSEEWEPNDSLELGTIDSWDMDYDLIDDGIELLEPEIIDEDYFDQFVQTCPTCNSEKLFVNYEKVEVICNNCGLILKGTIELYNTSEKKAIEDKYNFKHFSQPVELKYDPFNADLEFPEPPEFFYNEDDLDYIDINSLIDSYEIHEFDSNEGDEPDPIFEEDGYDSYSDPDFLVDEESRLLLIDQEELILENEKFDDLYHQELNFEEEIMIKFAESLDPSKLKNISDESKVLNLNTEEKTAKNIESIFKPDFLKKKYIDDHSDDSLKSLEDDFDESDIICHLIKTLKDSDPNVRREAAISLGIIGDMRAVKYLEEALKDPIMKVRESVRYAISKIKNENSRSNMDFDYDDDYNDDSEQVYEYLEDDNHEATSSNHDLTTRLIEENDEYMDDIISGLYGNK